MNIEEIVEKWLKDNRYDGLYNTDEECGCVIGDLMPCMGPNEQECLAGVKIEPPPEGHKFYIGERRKGGCEGTEAKQVSKIFWRIGP